MKKIEDIIQFGGETDSLDFKGIQYTPTMHEEFLKDIIAFANADVDSLRRIVCGVKEIPGGANILTGFKKSDFIDSANFQKLVRDNVEPHLEFTYEPIELNGLTFGVFTIPPHQDRPFMMRKDFGQHKRGDSWIRIGTHEPRLTRPDIDRIFNERSDPSKLANNVSLLFEKSKSQSLEIRAIIDVDVPSDLRAKALQDALGKRQRLDNGAFHLPVPHMTKREQLEGYFGSGEFVAASADYLKAQLATVRTDYAADDLYDLFEVRGERVQLLIRNMGEGFLNDPLIELKIPQGQGIYIADKVFSKPNRNSRMFTPAIPEVEDPFERLNYPSVEVAEGHYNIVGGPDKARHANDTSVFQVPLRVFADASAVGKTIDIDARLSAENLKNPINAKLKIQVVS